MTFFDTNILVYLFDEANGRKRARALEVFREAKASRTLVLSSQVLSEFYTVVLRKPVRGMTAESARKAITAFQKFPVLPIDSGLVLRAIDRKERSQINYWDALIVESALQTGSSILYSEDLQHGQSFDSLRIQNPFRDAPSSAAAG